MTDAKPALDWNDHDTLFAAFEAVADLAEFRPDDTELTDLILDLDELMGRVCTILGDPPETLDKPQSRPV